jgi:hypothetical protein
LLLEVAVVAKPPPYFAAEHSISKEDRNMGTPNHAKETTSPAVAKLAAKVLAGELKPTPKQIKTFAGSVFTQSPGKGK